MKALTYHGAHDVRVEQVPEARLFHPQDIILRVTATAICGSDLQPLDQAAHGCAVFDRKEEDCRKFVLTPGGPTG